MEDDKKYYCKICKKDLTDVVKILGVESWEYHLHLHIKYDLIKEINRSHNLIKELYEESTYYKKQIIKSFFAAIPDEIKTII